MDEQVFIDRILEAENLTDNLEDETASLLLKWGVSRARAAVPAQPDEDQAGEWVNALMKVMRRINHIIGDAGSAAVEDIQADLEQVLELYQPLDAAAKDVTSAPAGLEAVAATIAQAPPQQGLLALLNWLAPDVSQEPATPTPQGPAAPTPQGTATPASQGPATPTPQGPATPAPQESAAPTPQDTATPAPQEPAVPTPQEPTSQVSATPTTQEAPPASGAQEIAKQAKDNQTARKRRLHK